MTVRLRDVVSFLDTTLEIGKFRDYGPNGLQVEGTQEVDTIVVGVSASLELIERAVALEADLVVVHHGLIWGPGITAVTGVTARRLTALLKSGVSLAAYHLPLDAHPRLGNNVALCDAIGLGAERQPFGEVRGQPIGLMGAFSESMSRAAALDRIAAGVLAGAPPPFVFANGPEQVRTVACCSGAASDLIETAALAGCDLFLTGELAERAGELAKELQITLVAAGHYATEVFGVQRVGQELQRRFPDLKVHFVSVPNPL